MDKQKVVLVDAHALIHRAYHALPFLTDTMGVPINAVYGFSKILLRVLKELDPQYIAIVFDTRAPTFRHLAYKEYKANRPPAPDDLKIQFPIVRKIVKEFNLPLFAIEGYEADDVIGSLAEEFKKESKNEIYIVTGDWDTAQLVEECVKIYPLTKKIEDSRVFAIKDIINKFELEPSQIVDFKALKGDPSDNIPGVKGIGDKTALYLLHKFDDLDNIYNNLDKIELKYRKKLEKDKDNAYMSKSLATISRDVPLNFKSEKCIWNGWQEDNVIAVLDKYGFKSLKKSIRKVYQSNSREKEGKNDEQLSLV